MPELRVGAGEIMYESNSFSPVDKSLHDFRAGGEVIAGPGDPGHGELRNEFTGFVDAVKGCGRDIEIVPLLRKPIDTGGSVAEECISWIDEELCKALRRAGALDGVFLALHGSMASAAVPDAEGHFLEIVRREKGDSIPIVCSLDLHANVTGKMADLATVLTVYRTTPHVDLVETGRRAARTLLQVLFGGARPTMVVKKIPMMIPPNEEGTASGPLKRLYDRVAAMSRPEGVIDCSFCCSNAWLDVPEQGWAALAVTDNDHAAAEKIADELARTAWEDREEYLPDKKLSGEDAVRSAASSGQRPAIILDTGDIPGGGAPGDGTELLKVLMDRRRDVDGLILADLPDAQAVRQAAAAGEGAKVTVSVGGKLDSRFSGPLSFTGKVLCLTGGAIESVWADRGTPHVDAGGIVCLGIDNVRLVLTERVLLWPQPFLFRKVGLEPSEAGIIAVKTSRIGCRKAYGKVPGAVFAADCGGATSLDLDGFEYKHITRPIYPLDPDMKWRME